MGYIFIVLSSVSMFFSMYVNHKYHKRILCLGLFFMLIIMGFAYGLPDEFMYETYYLKSENFELKNAFDYEAALIGGYGRDPGHMLLIRSCKQIGLSYQEFKFILHAFVIYLFYKYVFLQCKLGSFFFIMYLVYPMGMDVIQQRNYLIEIMFFISFYYYCYVEGYKRYLIWIGLLIIAATFHSSALAFIPFVLFDKILDSRFKYIVYIFLLMCLLMPLYSEYLQQQFLLLKLLLNDGESALTHYSGYLDKTVSHQYVWCYIFVIISYLFSCFFNRVKNKYGNLSVHNNLYIDKTKRFLLYNFCFFPLYPLFLDVALRLPRNSMLLIFMSITLIVNFANNSFKLLYLGLGICLALLMGRIDLYNPTLIVNVDILMNRNYFFDFLGF